MDAPLALHTRHGGPIDHTGALPWSGRFDAYIGRCVPNSIAAERQMHYEQRQAELRQRREWHQNPSIMNWLLSQPIRFPGNAVAIIAALKDGAEMDDLCSEYAVSKTWVLRQGWLMENAVFSEFMTGRID